MVLPFVRDLLADLERSETFERVRRHLAAGSGRRRIAGLTFTARSLYLPSFVKAANGPCLILVADNKAAEALHLAVTAACELTGALAPESVLRLPGHDVLPFENLSPHPEIQEHRAATLWKLCEKSASKTSATPRLIIAPVEAACMRLFPRDFYNGLALRLRTGEEYMPDMLVDHLLSVGYTKVDVVEMPGQVTLRGGILDVYSPEQERPVRIDFFGDEIESIRKFDPETQRSSSPTDHVLLLPLTEFPITEKILAAVNARLTRSGSAAGANLEGGEQPRELQTHVATRSGEATIFPGWEFFAPVAGANGTLLDLLGPTTRVFIEEPAMVKNQGERWWNKVEQRHERAGIGNLIRPEDIYISPWALDDRLRDFSGCELDQLGAVDILDADRSDLSEVDFHTRPTQRFHGSIPTLIEAIKDLTLGDTRVLLTAPNQGEVERLASLLQEYGVPYRLGSRNTQPGSTTVYSESSYLGGDLRTPVIVKTAIANGVQVLDLDKATARQIVLFGAQDLTDDADVAPRVTRRTKSKTSAFISDFRDLAVGDYVVHVEHGIARYCGLRVLDEDPAATPLELMILEFADEAKLYVPLTRLDLIQKYRSTDTGPAPQLNKLGNPAWQKTKARVKKAMADMAGELLKLYAQRKAAQGTPFSPDTNMQHEFEDAFDFTETDDQLSAIADIKRDMESTQPMDRLLCGDVGYGKTEVAMRAAFKAVQDGKQVAVLAPTTVLSFQHFESFKKRFANFPVNIDMLSRFRTAKEKAEVMEKCAEGKIDILVGTHAILGQSLKFQDLGLLIVDEEQRFGVKHKERLKQMRASIDVLAMSATPIPRTLHMSLIGLRDMSVIETPPKDRMAIQTIVAKFDEKLMRTAIEMELERGGQTYFVHNRVETIYELASKIRELVPSARVVVGHGQLPEAELERVMLAFMNHEYDVLCATSIIENGLDIPLANTIIINRADRHGLSELYQLRGRVGRSNRRAYAYLLIPPETELTEIARRRLAALKEFSDLGAGFKIAALDLELRGAGNMLGGEQSGHIEAIGFEMYTTMLGEAVAKLKGEDGPTEETATLNLGISLRIDATYIPEENQRLRMYKKIAGAPDEATLEDVRAELADRYGDIPDSVKNLLSAGEIRIHCERLGIASLERKRTAIDLPADPKAAAKPAPTINGRQSIPGRYGQAPVHNPLQHTYRAVASRPVTNATMAVRATAGARPATPGQAGSIKPMREMLYVKFTESTHAPAESGRQKMGIDPGLLMKLVSRNTKNGAQFTPQGVLRWPLTSAKAEDVLTETRALLNSLDPAS
ncbi:transcription-repair coupling factor [Granulicella sibirica]|uniref:Transcription-repair-coupling factor n=1 Tax=Granulicella sibirica TaxID=2479048 RepID=A0A4Q0T591_9BACT|nr:transcription-repair coupling factor [Granulicella sibirica]RXH57780.1 Transcription-repair coupling factor [Granulicella sibirica]